MPRSVAALVLLLACSLGTSGCGEGRGTTREWKPEDHDQADGTGRQVAAASARAPDGAVDPSLIELSWQQKCATCHGPVGRGDGPQGPMVEAPDLTRAALAQVSDEDLSAVIRLGRGRMPPFNLPPSVLTGLVKRIRTNNGQPR